jgi:hypothetical protein
VEVTVAEVPAVEEAVEQLILQAVQVVVHILVAAAAVEVLLVVAAAVVVLQVVAHHHRVGDNFRKQI